MARPERGEPRAADQVSIMEKRLENAREKLRRQIRANIDLEKQLSVLSMFSARMAMSLETGHVLDTAVDLVRSTMKAEISMIFSIDEERGSLRLEAAKGISPETMKAVDNMRLGQGLNGRVALTGECMVVEDVASDERITVDAVREEGIQSAALVPLVSRGKICGTLCVATRRHRVFTRTETDLLMAIGNQIGIAMENARLYHQREEILNDLQASERRFRELFENTNDAIWLVDLEGRVTAGNAAMAQMVGVSPEGLAGKDEDEFLAPEGRETARRVRARILSGDEVKESYDQRIMKADGGEAILKVATTPLKQDGAVVGFQHIGKDVTRERRMHDNLRHYLQAITRAQEEERLRIARELHDSTAQTLIAILHRLEKFLEEHRDFSMSDSRFLWTLQADIKSALQEVRHFSRDLRPSILDDLGLLPAVEWLLDELARHRQIETKLRVTGGERRFLPEEETTLFRIMQEALNNVARHSRADHVEVVFEMGSDQVKVIVKDDGQGFCLTSVDDLVRAGKLGLAGMRERAQLLGGRVSIETRPGCGTLVTVVLPVAVTDHSHG